MKRTLLFLAALVSAQSFAQQFMYSGASLISNTIPFSSTSSNFRQSIYYPSNFPTAPSGNITAIYLLASSGTTPNLTNITIKMGYTTSDTFTSQAFVTTGLQTVYTGPYNQAPQSGNYIKINLQTPFAYDNTKNFILELSQTGYTTGVSIMQASVGLSARSIFGAVGSATGNIQDRLATLGLDIDTALDVTETFMEKNISVYPNPTTDFLQVTDVSEKAAYQILDTSGRIIKSGNIKNKKVDVSNLTKGNYIISISERD